MDTAVSPLEQLKRTFGLGEGRPGLIVIAIAAIGLLVIVVALLLLVRRLFRRAPAGPGQERGVAMEDLSSMPPAPTPGSWIVTAEGVPVRVRLVVVAPIGKGNVVDADSVPVRLDQVIRGLGSAVREDQARIRVWPMQLSNQGFGPTFHRMVRRPEADGKPSRWVLIAGQTPTRPKPLLLGLALQADEANAIGRLTLMPEQWSEVLRVQGR